MKHGSKSISISNDGVVVSLEAWCDELGNGVKASVDDEEGYVAVSVKTDECMLKKDWGSIVKHVLSAMDKRAGVLEGFEA